MTTDSKPKGKAKANGSAPVDDTKAEAYRERAEADFDPVETAQARLERLQRETKEQIKQARKAVREEAKAEADAEFEKVVGPKLEGITALLREIEGDTGKIFRNFSYYFKFPKGATEPEIKMNHSLVSPRGESTVDDE